MHPSVPGTVLSIDEADDMHIEETDLESGGTAKPGESSVRTSVVGSRNLELVGATLAQNAGAPGLVTPVQPY